MKLLKILSFTCSSLILFAHTALADNVTVPIFASYALIQQLLQQALFKSPEHTAIYNADKSGCTTVSFAKPNVAGGDGFMQMRANVDLTLGLPNSAQKCTVLTQWAGSTTLKGAPFVVDTSALAVQFKVIDAQVFDASGKQMQGGLIKQALQSRLHPLLDQYKLDLQPAVARAKAVLPPLLPGYSREQLTHLFDSVRLGDVKASSGGLTLNLQMDALDPQLVRNLAASSVKSIQKSAVASGQEEWEAFLTTIIQQMSTKTDSPEIREALLEVLQDARRQLKGAVHGANTNETDPLRQVFIDSWERLAPLARTMNTKAPQQDLLQLLAYVSATDLLATLDTLGNALGFDVSVGGLRKFVQLLNISSATAAVK